MKLSIKDAFGFRNDYVRMDYTDHGITYGTLLHRDTSSRDFRSIYRILRTQVDLAYYFTLK